MSKKVIGQKKPKIDGMALATGKPAYTDDIANPNALVVKLLRSPHAFARIKSIDTSRAEKLDGIEAVFTYKDVPRTRFTLAGQSNPEVSPYDRLILDELVRYVGDEVAIVAAVDEKTALKALKLIKVAYEVLDPVLDFEQAADNPIVVHPEDNVHLNFEIGMEKSKNIVATDIQVVGDIDRELSECDVIAEGVYYPQAQAHAMMETYRAYTYMDPFGQLVVVSSTQVPFHLRRHVARALELPMSKVRVIKPRIGGGFGGKQTVSGDLFAAFVTYKTGKPAKIIYDRQETFTCTTSRHAMRLKVRIGADREGFIRAIDLDVLSDTGAYGEHASTVLGCVGHYTLPLYGKMRAIRFVGHAVYTNKMPAGAFRGYGATQGTFAVESTINKLAHELGMDPTELRLKNIIREGETALHWEDGTRLGSTALDRCIRKGKEMIGWEEKGLHRRVGPHKVRGLGMAVTMQGSGIAYIDTASAEIRLNDMGDYVLMHGATDNGMGADTILAQMAAEVLETEMDHIIVRSVDTDYSPYDPGAYASSGTYVSGSAVVKAAENLKAKILEEAAHYLQVPVGEVELTKEAVHWVPNAGEDRLNGDANPKPKAVSLAELAERSVLGSGKNQLVGQATFGSEVSPPPYVAGFAEVEVDQETGKVDLIQFVAVADCGTVINPNLARIQVEGGVAQGIGMALYEDVKYDQQGRMLSDSFMQYKIPTRKDVGTIRVAFEESYEPTGPFGAKSVGEVVANTPAPAITEAVYNAVGVRVTDLPITPEKLFMRMSERNS